MISPFFADLFLWLMYIVLAVAMVVTAYSVWHGMRTRRKGDDIVNRVPAGRIGWCVLFGLLISRHDQRPALYQCVLAEGY